MCLIRKIIEIVFIRIHITWMWLKSYVYISVSQDLITHKITSWFPLDKLLSFNTPTYLNYFYIILFDFEKKIKDYNRYLHTHLHHIERFPYFKSDRYYYKYTVPLIMRRWCITTYRGNNEISTCNLLKSFSANFHAWIVIYRVP